MDKYARLCTSAKTEYYNSVNTESKGDTKKLFQVTKALLHQTTTTPLRVHTSPKELANDFSDYFISKIDTIHEKFSDNSCFSKHNRTFNGSESLSSFKPLTQDEVTKLVSKAPSKSSVLNLIPTFLLKKMW